MASQIPLKVLLDSNSCTCGLAQFTSSDSVAVAAGGTGLTSQGICAFAQPGIQGSVGCQSTYIGICAGKSEGAAAKNTYVGYAAGQEVTSGCFHTIIGSNAGAAITTCSSSVLIGYNAGTAITFGDYNTLIGTEAGEAVVTADGVTAIGMKAAKSTICSDNTAVGRYAMLQNTQGQNNTVVGSSAGYSMVAAGCNNTMIGFKAGCVALCRDNTLVGTDAGRAQTTATCNVMLGGCVGYGVVGGAGNVYLGYKSGLVNTSGNDNVFIGKAAGVASTASCCLIIGNGTCDIIVGNFDIPRVGMVGCVGIGTLAPATPLQVYGISRFSRTDSTPSGTANTVLNDAVFGSTDTANTGITLLGTGQVGIAFGDAASTEIGQVRYQHSTNAMEFRTNGAEAMMIDNAGCVGIGTTAPDGELHVFSGESSGVAPNVAADELILEGSGDVGMTILSGASSSASIFFADTGSALDGYVQYYQHDQSMTFGTAAATRMKIVSSGNVGIGTATPDGNLHVMSSSAGSVTAHSNACTGVFEASDYAGISIIGASESSIHFADAGSNIVSRIHYDHAGNNLAIDTNSAEVMRLTSAGNVGIGTATPAKIFSVYGATDTTTATDPVARFERTGASQTGITVRSNNLDGLLLRADSAGLGSVHGNTDLAFYTGATPGSDYGTKNWIMLDNLGTLCAAYYSAGSGCEAIRIYSESAAFAKEQVSLVTNTAASSSTNGVLRIHQEASPHADFRAIGYTQSGSNTQVFRVMGDGDVENANNSYGSTSDIKIKQDITDARSYWDDFKALQFKKFRIKRDVEADSNAPYKFGLIAQDVETIFPGVVKDTTDLNIDGTVADTTTKSIKYSVISQIGLKVVQELQEKIEELESRLLLVEA